MKVLDMGAPRVGWAEVLSSISLPVLESMTSKGKKLLETLVPCIQVFVLIL